MRLAHYSRGRHKMKIGCLNIYIHVSFSYNLRISHQLHIGNIKVRLCHQLNYSFNLEEISQYSKYFALLYRYLNINHRNF